MNEIITGEIETTLVSEELSKREYFAAHAPSVIPHWFEHERVTTPANFPNWLEIENDKDREMVRSWISDGCFDLPEHLQWFEKDYTNAANLNQKTDVIEQQARYFQWRTFYADMMIAELNKPQP